LRICLRCQAALGGENWACSGCGYQPALVAGFPAFAPELASGNEGYDAAFYGDLYALEARNYWFRARNALLIWALRKYFPAAANFFEIGCGTGYVLAGIAGALPRLAMHASEVSSSGLSFAAQRVPGASLFQMDARAIPYVGHFDVIGLFDVLEHIEDDVRVLTQAHRALKRGGGLMITVPQHRFLWSRYDEHARHVRRYGAQELKRKALLAGFRIVMMTSFVSLVLPLMMLSRLMRRTPAADYDALAELRVGRVANFLLESTLMLERMLIRSGIRFPAGGSLLLIARRD